MTCASCSRAIPDAARFCPYCQYPQEARPAAIESSPPSKTAVFLVIATIVLTFVGVLLLLIALIAGNDGSTEALSEEERVEIARRSIETLQEQLQADLEATSQTPPGEKGPPRRRYGDSASLSPPEAGTPAREQLELLRDDLPSDVEPGSPNAIIRRQKRLHEDLMSKLLKAKADLDFSEAVRLLRSRASELRTAIAAAERNRTWSHADQREVLSVLREELSWAAAGADAIAQP